MIKGLPEGIDKTYYENGKLRSVQNYTHGLLNGEQRIYYENGILRQITEFENNAISTIIPFSSKGIKESKLFFEKGKLVQAISYYKNGNVEHEKVFNQSSDTAFHRVFNESGKLLAEFNSKGKDEI